MSVKRREAAEMVHMHRMGAAIAELAADFLCSRREVREVLLAAGVGLTCPQPVEPQGKRPSRSKALADVDQSFE